MKGQVPHINGLYNFYTSTLSKDTLEKYIANVAVRGKEEAYKVLEFKLFSDLQRILHALAVFNDVDLTKYPLMEIYTSFTEGVENSRRQTREERMISFPKFCHDVLSVDDSGK